MRERCGPRGRTGGKHRDIGLTNHPGRWLQQCSPRRAAAKTCDACGFCCSLETWCCLSSVAIAETKQFGVSERPSVVVVVPLRKSQPPYFLLFVLCLSTCRCSLIAAFFLPVIGKVLFPSRRPFLLAPLRFLQAIPGDGADEPNKRWLRDGRANRPRNESINHRCIAGQTFMRCCPTLSFTPLSKPRIAFPMSRMSSAFRLIIESISFPWAACSTCRLTVLLRLAFEALALLRSRRCGQRVFNWLPITKNCGLILLLTTSNFV